MAVSELKKWRSKEKRTKPKANTKIFTKFYIRPRQKLHHREGRIITQTMVTLETETVTLINKIINKNVGEQNLHDLEGGHYSVLQTGSLDSRGFWRGVLMWEDFTRSTRLRSPHSKSNEIKRLYNLGFIFYPIKGSGGLRSLAGVSRREAWCDRILLDTLGKKGHIANQAKINAFISYFRARTRSPTTEVGYILSPMERLWRVSNPGSLDSRCKRKEGLMWEDFAGITMLRGLFTCFNHARAGDVLQPEGTRTRCGRSAWTWCHGARVWRALRALQSQCPTA